ncbi:hypothetical protein B0T20DRAFT_391265 [Sordaria brevicollis]|uniref:Uncharacterized protein n=1 Tax=Sordaria brevicollis TaxID=83679 RepID=A0AAE0PH27_SORBR|nr:hypothetical protein B0T20DRAFT_391265 [Sordaria brevicollis]
MATLRHILLLSTVFTPALSSAINIPRQALSSDCTTTTSAEPTGSPGGIDLTPPDIPEWSPITNSYYESTNFGDLPEETDTSLEPSGTLPGHVFPIISLRPCTTTLTSTASARPCPPPDWDGTLTSWPSTTTLFKPVNCNGCMYVSVTKDWAVGCPNQHISATVLAATPSTTWTEVCEGVGAMPTASGAAGAPLGAPAVIVTVPPAGGEPPAMPTWASGGSSGGVDVTFT